MVDTLASRLDEYNNLGSLNQQVSSGSAALDSARKWGGSSQSSTRKEEVPWTFAAGRENSIIEYQRQAARLKAMGLDPNTVDDRAKDPWWAGGIKTLSGLGVFMDWMFGDAPIRMLVGGATTALQGKGFDTGAVIQGSEVDPYAEEMDYGKGALDWHAPTGKELLLMWGAQGQDRKGKVDWIDMAGLGLELAMSPDMWLTLGASSSAEAAAKGGTSAMRATSDDIMLKGAKSLQTLVEQSPEVAAEITAKMGEDPNVVKRLLATLTTAIPEGLDEKTAIAAFAEKMDAWSQLADKGVLDNLVVDYAKYADELADPRKANVLKRLGQKNLLDELEIARSGLLPSAGNISDMAGVGEDAGKSLQKLVASLSDEAVTSNKAFRELQLRTMERMGDQGGLKAGLPILSYLSGDFSTTLISQRTITEVGKRFGMDDAYRQWTRSLPGRAITRTFVSDWRIRKLEASDPGLAHQLVILKRAAEAESDNTLHGGINALVEGLRKLSNSERMDALRAIEVPGELVAEYKRTLNDSVLANLADAIVRTKGAQGKELQLGVKEVYESMRAALPPEHADSLMGAFQLAQASDGVKLGYSVLDAREQLEKIARSYHRKSLAAAEGLDFVPKRMGNNAADKGVQLLTSDELDAIGERIHGAMAAIEGMDEEGHRLAIEAADMSYLKKSAELYGSSRDLSLWRVTEPMDTSGIHPDQLTEGFQKLIAGDKDIVGEFEDEALGALRRYTAWSQARVAMSPSEKALNTVGAINELVALQTVRDKMVNELTTTVAERAGVDVQGLVLPASGKLEDLLATLPAGSEALKGTVIEMQGIQTAMGSLTELDRQISARAMDLFDLSMTKSSDEAAYKLALDAALQAQAESLGKEIPRHWSGSASAPVIRPMFNPLDMMNASDKTLAFTVEAAQVVDESENILHPQRIQELVQGLMDDPMRTATEEEALAWRGASAIPQTMYYQVYTDVAGDGFNKTLSENGLITAKVEKEGFDWFPEMPLVKVTRTPVPDATNVKVVARVKKLAIVQVTQPINAKTLMPVLVDGVWVEKTMKNLVDEGYEGVVIHGMDSVYLLPTKDGFDKLVARSKVFVKDYGDQAAETWGIAVPKKSSKAQAKLDKLLAQPNENPIIISFTDPTTGEVGQRTLAGAQAAALRKQAPKTWKTKLRSMLDIPKGARMHVTDAEGYIPTLRVVGFDPDGLVKLDEKVMERYTQLAEEHGSVWTRDMRMLFPTELLPGTPGDPVHLYHATAYYDEVVSGGLKSVVDLDNEAKAAREAVIEEFFTADGGRYMDELIADIKVSQRVSPRLLAALEESFGEDGIRKYAEQVIRDGDVDNEIFKALEKTVTIELADGAVEPNYTLMESMVNNLDTEIHAHIQPYILSRGDLPERAATVSGRDSLSGAGYIATTWSYKHAVRRLDAMKAIGGLGVGTKGAPEFLADVFDVWARIVPTATDDELFEAMKIPLARICEDIGTDMDGSLGLELTGQIRESMFLEAVTSDPDNYIRDLVTELRKFKADDYILSPETPHLALLDAEWGEAREIAEEMFDDVDETAESFASNAQQWWRSFEGGRNGDDGALWGISQLQSDQILKADPNATMRGGSVASMRRNLGLPDTRSLPSDLTSQLVEENLLAMSGSSMASFIKVGRNPESAGIVEVLARRPAQFALDDVLRGVWSGEKPTLVDTWRGVYSPVADEWIAHGGEAEFKGMSGWIQPGEVPIVLDQGTVPEFTKAWRDSRLYNEGAISVGKVAAQDPEKALFDDVLMPRIYADRAHGVQVLMDAGDQAKHRLVAVVNESGLQGASSHGIIQAINRSIKEGADVTTTVWKSDQGVLDVLGRLGFRQAAPVDEAGNIIKTVVKMGAEGYEDESVTLILTADRWSKFLAEEPEALTKGVVKNIDGKGKPLMYWRVFNRVDSLPEDIQVAVDDYLMQEAERVARDQVAHQRAMGNLFDSSPKDWMGSAGLPEWDMFSQEMQDAARSYYQHGNSYSAFEKLTVAEADQVETFVDVLKKLNKDYIGDVANVPTGRQVEGMDVVAQFTEARARSQAFAQKVMNNENINFLDDPEVQSMMKVWFDFIPDDSMPAASRAEIARMGALIDSMANEVKDDPLVRALGMVPEDLQERFFASRAIHKVSLPDIGDDIEIGAGISKRAVDAVNERWGAPMTWVRMADQYGLNPDDFSGFIKQLWEVSKEYNSKIDQFGKYLDEGERILAMQKFIGERMGIDPTKWSQIDAVRFLLPASEYAPHVQLGEAGISFMRQLVGDVPEGIGDVNNRVFYRPVSTKAPHLQQRRTIQGSIDAINKMFGREYFYEDPGRAMAQYIQESTRTLTNARMIGTLLDMTDSYGNRVVMPAMWNAADSSWKAPAGYKVFTMTEMSKVGERVSAWERFFPELVGDLHQLKKNAGSVKFMARSEIVDEFEYAARNFFPDEQMASYMKQYDKVLGIWKSFATVMRPGFHVRNAISNVWQNMYAGIVNPKWYQQAMEVQSVGTKVDKFITDEMVEGRIWNFKSAYDAMVEKGLLQARDYQLGNRFYKLGDVYAAMKETGVIGTGRIGSDIHVFTDQQLKSLSWRSKLNPFSQSFFWTSGGRQFGEMVENNARAAHFLAMFDSTGGDAAAAAWSVRKYLFDYNELTDIERNVFKRVLPFYSWIRKNSELQVRQLLSRPMPITTAVRVTNWMSKTDDTRYKPAWVNEIGGFALPGMTLGEVNRLANKATGGRWGLDETRTDPMYVSVGLPYMDFLNYNGKDMFSAISPIIKVPIETITNRDVFKGREISQGLGDMVKAPNTLQAIDQTIGLLDKNPELQSDWENALESWGVVRNPLTNTLQVNAWGAYIWRQMAPHMEALGKTAPSEDPAAFTQVLNYWSGVKLIPADQEMTGYYEEKARADYIDQYVQMLKEQGKAVPLWSELPEYAQIQAELEMAKQKAGK